jgi:signal transduction histidine kinase
MAENFPRNLNVVSLCRRYGVSLWQCPQFLFLVMGIVIIGSSTGTYLIGTRFINDPEIVSLIVLLVSTALFVIAFTITRSFEKLAEVSRMKSEFIDIVSHQLRSPLTNLKWAVELISSGDLKRDPKRTEEYYSVLKENIGRMLELVDELLIVSKIEQGVLILRKKEVDFKKLVEDLISRSKFYALASNIEIKFHSGNDLPTVFADPSQVKLVVENLIDNAIRYTKKEGVIDIWLEKREKQVLFRIKDSGVGIPEEDKKYIFQKFFRAENIMREQTRGSGLGLFVAKSIVESSGGKIWFESKEGKGTTFYFTLPI